MAPHRALRSIVWLVLVAAVASGCSSTGFHFQWPIAKNQKEVRFGPGKLTAAAIQSEVMSFADTFDAAVVEQWNRIESDARAKLAADASTLSEAELSDANRMRRAALENKLATISSSLSIASSPNPAVGLVDMITMISLQRIIFEGPSTVERYGEEHAQELAELYRAQEEKIWRIAQRAMYPKYQQELRNLISNWRKKNPETTYVANVRLEDFARDRQQTVVDTEHTSDSLLSLVALDPLAGLEPAQREVLMSRMFAERMFFYASRMPQVLKWQVESLTQSVLRTPELRQVMGSIDQFADSAQRVAAVTEQLPEAQDKFQNTLHEFRDTMTATNEAAETLTKTIRAADEFAARFKSGPESNVQPDGTKRNALADYQAAAAQTGDAASRLTVFAEKVDELLDSPALSKDSGVIKSAVVDVQSRAESVIDYAFVRLLAIALIVPFAIALAIGLYRRLKTRYEMRSSVGGSYG